ncbi:MAG: hypothetical protein KKB50_19415 [Planctomycetes bacterium]|nr:hypothetical protein [Planctomycetota bacterium]
MTCAAPPFPITHENDLHLPTEPDVPTKHQVRRFRQIQKWKRWLPELEAYEDEQECIEDWKHAYNAAAPWRWILVLLVTTVCIGVAAALVRVLATRYIPIAEKWVPGVVGGILGGFFPIIYLWVFRRRVRKELHNRLLARGIRTCANCGYLLRGQSEPRCPECGTPYDDSDADIDNDA